MDPEFGKFELTADRQAPTLSKESNGPFHTMSQQDPLQGETEPKFSISCSGLGHRSSAIWPNQQNVEFISSNMDRVRLMEFGMWVEVDDIVRVGIILTLIKVQGQGHGTRRNLRNMLLRKIDRLRRGHGIVYDSDVTSAHRE